MKNSCISIHDMSFSFNDNVIFKEASIDIYEGEIVALIGPNGAGKTTLFNLILNKYKNYTGKIELFNQKEYLKHNYKNVTYISQNIISSYKDFPTTIEELIKVHLKYLKLKKNVDNILSIVKLEEHKHKMLSELSGGQLQRVALALAFMKDSKLIILDEPTNNIDKKFINELFLILKRLSLDNKTILIATHNLRNAINYVDKIVQIDHKKLHILSKLDIRREMMLSNGHSSFY